ncbi:hypothetical protein GUITHDRAFT_103943 [Guillardia theta CCMP2712]|uniref:Uncharacterized protein n=1 Tax=Guillardia theta (strain CCMP2712) TaxID=905079 RepID=L1JPB8_GUITC|nr:hypothetical protein GUITHDRAFT_103943 [Guillardia theta CCMP2712]EKX50129.1 hypothetical protein GUITHDRAFT_103943 [Guillardia theta CCMP2712]|eukprot:XP_005837109.1 hypothetical protein GUITHDRAFT_103943 [Guillardia theta CCMP2712]
MNTRSSPPPPEPISSSPPPASPQCIPPDSPQYNTSDHNHQRQALPPPSFSRIAFNGNGAPASHVNALEGSLATKSLTRGHINEANGENGLNVSLHHPLLSLSDSFAAETYSPPGDERPVAGQSISNGFHGQESTNEKAKASRNSKQRSEAQKYNKSSASYPSSYYCQHAETVVLRTDFSTNGISHRRLEFMPMSLVQSPPPHHPLSIGGPIKARKGMRVILTKEGSKAFDEQFHNISGGGIGTISKVLNNGMMCKVVWDNDPKQLEHCYRTGRFSRFELALYDSALLASIPRSAGNSPDKLLTTAEVGSNGLRFSVMKSMLPADSLVASQEGYQDQDLDPVTLELRKHGIFPPPASSRQRAANSVHSDFEGVPMTLRTSRLKRLFDRDRDGFFTCVFTSEIQQKLKNSTRDVSGDSTQRSEVNMAWA